MHNVFPVQGIFIFTPYNTGIEEQPRQPKENEMDRITSYVSGVSGTVKWFIDCAGLMFFTPLEGNKGTLADTYKFEREWSEYAQFIEKIRAEGTIYLPKNSSCLFNGCFNLIDADLSDFNTSNATDMNCMFEDCYSLECVDLSSFDTSDVSNMGGMFNSCYSLRELDLSGFDTSNVTNMHGMFMNCHKLQKLKLSSFDTRCVTSMSGMFYNCRSLTGLDLFNFDTRNVIDMESMFSDCLNLECLNFPMLDLKNEPDVSCIVDGCNLLKDFIVADSLDEKCKKLAFFYKFSNRIPVIMPFIEKQKLMYGLFDNIEKLTGLDFSKEKQKLSDVSRADVNDLTKWKVQQYSNSCSVSGKLFDIIKLLAAHSDIEKMAESDITMLTKVLKESGAMSDIDAYLSGVPLEDILA